MINLAVIFGGTGFIGRHFSHYLLAENIVDKVIVVDIVPLDISKCTVGMMEVFDSNRFEYIEHDVRQKININIKGQTTLIGNFAAIHREPGHMAEEYYETNILGAENVCVWAHEVGCNQMLFISSIASYGPSIVPKDETALPAPVSAYGGSKLAAEKIHENWQVAEEGRYLIVVRPGVVFGPGEGGNVTRLIKAVLGRYFFYMGNKQTRKAGIYVKELCRAMIWVLNHQKERNSHYALFNMSMNPVPTIENYVASICQAAGVSRWMPSLPIFCILTLSYFFYFTFGVVGYGKSFNPMRVRKLKKANNIIPGFLIRRGYEYHFTLDQAFSDWHNEMSSEW